jgi:hypothetical protein
MPRRKALWSVSTAGGVPAAAPDGPGAGRAGFLPGPWTTLLCRSFVAALILIAVVVREPVLLQGGVDGQSGGRKSPERQRRSISSMRLPNGSAV